MLLKTRGIIFRSVKYSESSLILDIFTEEKGMQTFIISGVRSPKSKIGAGMLQVTSLVDLVVYFRDDRSMHRIKEVKPVHVYQRLLFDVRRSSIGIFIAEVCQKTIHVPEENKPLFRFLLDIFIKLDVSEFSAANLHLYFLTELSSFLGFQPGGEYSTETSFFDLKEGVFQRDAPLHPLYLSPELSRLLFQFINSDPEHIHTIALSRLERKQMLDALLSYFRYHIDNFRDIHSHKILEEVLST